MQEVPVAQGFFYVPLAGTVRNTRHVVAARSEQGISHFLNHLASICTFARPSIRFLIPFLRLPFSDLRVAPFPAGVTLFPCSPAFLERGKRPASPSQYLLLVI